jgi:peptide/nickel transport system substrate-binding protein
VPASLTTRPGGPLVTSPTVPGALDEAARLPAGEHLDTTQAGRPSLPESGLPQKPASLPARRQSKRVVMRAVALLVVLVAAGSGLVYWLKLGPFGTGAATAAPASGYAYVPTTNKGGTITFSATIFPASTNPWFVCCLPDAELAAALWGNPSTISPTGTFLPDELTEIPTQANGGVSKDGLTVTMHLKPDLRWSDGQSLTADDFAYWLKVLLDPATGLDSTYGYNKIGSYQAMDAQTLVLHYQQVFASYVFYLPLAAPRHAWGTFLPQDLRNRDDVNLYPAVTSGPFKLVGHVAGQSMTLVPNPYYLSTTLHGSVLDQLIFTAYANTDAMIAAFEAGETDFSDSYFSPADIPKISSLVGYHISRTIGYTHLEFNLSRLALQDEQVRKAIEEAINRCGIIQTVFQVPCARLQVDTILSPPSPYYDPTIKTFGYNLAQAQQDMKVAGWECSSGTCLRAGHPFPALHLATLHFFQSVAEQVKRDLETLGIPVSLDYYPLYTVFGDYTSGGILAQGQYDLSIFFFIFGLDPDSDLSTFDSSQIPSALNPGGSNWERVKDSNIDRALDEGRMTLDAGKRAQLYQDLQRELVDHVFVVPLYLVPNIALVRPNIGNYHDNPLGFSNLWNVGDWFLNK